MIERHHRVLPFLIGLPSFLVSRPFCSHALCRSFQAALVQSATAKFEREMMLHAEDITTLQKVKAELEETKAVVKAAEDAASAARSELEVSKTSWESQRRMLEQEVSKLENRFVKKGIFLSLRVFLFLFLCVRLSLAPSMPLYHYCVFLIFLCVCLFVSVCLCISLFVSPLLLCVFVFHVCAFFCLSVCLYLSPCLCLSLRLFLGGIQSALHRARMAL